MKRSDSASILFADNHLLVAYKPPKMLTQPDASDNESLEAFAKAWVKKEYAKEGNVFLHCIHRLDRPVSGLVLFARSSKALARLNEQSRALEIQRTYLAEVEGILPEKEGRLDHFLVHGEHKALVVKEGTEGAKHARLTYEVLHYLPHTSCIQIALETGRYHQIRAQFGAIGHPIVGDRKYGGSGNGESIHLHCHTLSFIHPVTKESLKFTSPSPFCVDIGE